MPIFWLLHALLSQLITQYQSSEVAAIATHPNQPRVTIAGLDGVLQSWEYETGKAVASHRFVNGMVPSSLAYSPDGHTLAVGFYDGQLWFLDTIALRPVTENSW